MIRMDHLLTKNFNIPRISRLITNAIQKFCLSLDGLNVLTEAASGYYMFTPIIAALAGSERVYALTRDSSYGKATDIRDATMFLAGQFKVEDHIEVLFSRDAHEIGNADIVTNLGHVRPLDKTLLSRVKKTAAIPLMFESWEFRPDDIDLFECRKIRIPVLATNEGHPVLQIFRYVGHLAVKLLFELHVEIVDSRIMVLGSGNFGIAVVESLRNAGATVIHLETEHPRVLTLPDSIVAIKECDAMVAAEHVSQRQLIGPDGLIRGEDLVKLNPGLVLAHIAGDVDQEDIRKSGIRHLPKTLAKSGYMSVTTDYLGPRPLIDLHTAGLKVGEIMARCRKDGMSFYATLKESLKCPLCQDLSEEQKRLYDFPL
jgi:hypothetical protein